MEKSTTKRQNKIKANPDTEKEIPHGKASKQKAEVIF